MHSRIQYLGPSYFAARYFGARYFAVTFRPDPQRIVEVGFESRSVSPPSSLRAGEAGVLARVVAVAAESRVVRLQSENRRVVAEPADREVA